MSNSACFLAITVQPNIVLQRHSNTITFFAYSLLTNSNNFTLLKHFNYKKCDRDLCDKHQMPLYITFMAENHGKGKWDGAGGYFTRVYTKDGVLVGKDKNRSLTWFSNWFNTNRSLPKYCKKIKIGGDILSFVVSIFKKLTIIFCTLLQLM